jgi:hypothetical protein
LHGEKWIYNPDEDESYAKAYLGDFGKENIDVKESVE